MNNNKGFTLVEILIAAGLLAAVSYGVMQVIHHMQKGQVSSETKMEELELKRVIISTLLDKGACQQTLVGKGIGANITDIKNSSGTNIYSVNGVYGENAVKIVDIKTQDKNQVGVDGLRAVDLVVTTQKMKKILNVNASRITNIQLRVKASGPTASIQECYSDTDAIILLAKQEACLAIDGDLNSVSGKCELNQNSSSNSSAVSVTYGDNRYVKKSGDTMTGDLTAPKVNAIQFCISGNCRTTFANQQCPLGQIADGFNTDGTIKCRTLLCPSNMYVEGIGSGGNVICKGLPNTSCPTNQYVTEVRADGTVSCANLPPNAAITCGANQAIQTINSDHSVVCASVHKNLNGNACPANQAISGLDGSGNIVCSPVVSNLNVSCPAGQALTGISNNAPVCGSAGFSTRVVSSVAVAWRWANAYAYCAGDEKIVGGGGNCSGGSGYNFVVASEVSGNGWHVGCDTPNNQTNQAVVYAICAK